MRKTVIETMKANPKVTFFIGSETSFFFIGNYDEWLANGHMVTRDMKRNHDLKQKTARQKTPVLIKDLERLMKKDIVDTKAVSDVTAALQKNARILSTPWVDIEQRTPDAVRKRTQGDGIILVLPGVESGTFWFEHEYRSRYAV